MELDKIRMSNIENNINISITFPDGNKMKFSKGINGLEIAKSISKSLEKKAIAIKVNDKYKDLTDKIGSDANIEIITTDSNIGLDIMRHTLAAQVLATANSNIYEQVTAYRQSLHQEVITKDKKLVDLGVKNYISQMNNT